MNATNTTSAVYDIHETRKEWLLEKLATINRKAAKLGVEPVTLTWKGSKQVKVMEDGQFTGEWATYLTVEVSGVTPKLAGWSFVATLQHAGEEAGTVIRSIPGFSGQIPHTYRTASRFNCDHCQTLRARKDTYLVQNDQGEFKQVGSSCLGDFLGGMDPHTVTRWAGYLFQVTELMEGAHGGSGDNRVDLEAWLYHVAAAIRVDGRWMSRKQARELSMASMTGETLSTSEVASSRFFARGSAALAATAAYRPTAEDVEFAAKAMEWTRETFFAKDSAARSDFEHNLVVVASQLAIEPRSMGIAACVVGMYYRHLTTAADTTGKDSKHFGAVGERLVVTVTVLGEPKPIANGFGGSWLYKFLTADGNVATWFSDKKVDAMTEGATLTIVGTVKKHSNYQGRAETQLIRVAKPSEKTLREAARKTAQGSLNLQA